MSAKKKRNADLEREAYRATERAARAMADANRSKSAADYRAAAAVSREAAEAHDAAAAVERDREMRDAHKLAAKEARADAKVLDARAGSNPGRAKRAKKKKKPAKKRKRANLSPAQVRKQKADIAKQAREDVRRKERERIAVLRAGAKAVKAAKREAIRAARAHCKAMAIKRADDAIAGAQLACHVGRAKARRKNRPPSPWWDACIAGVEAKDGRGVRSASAACGASWWGMSEARRRAIVRRMARSRNPEQRRIAHAIARAERRHAKRRPRRRKRRATASTSSGPTRRNPKELVSLTYRETKPDDDGREHDYEHEFEGKLPQLKETRGRLRIKGGSYRIKEGWIHG
jgi:hypothetical protein